MSPNSSIVYVSRDKYIAQNAAHHTRPTVSPRMSPSYMICTPEQRNANQGNKQHC